MKCKLCAEEPANKDGYCFSCKVNNELLFGDMKIPVEKRLQGLEDSLIIINGQVQDLKRELSNPKEKTLIDYMQEYCNENLSPNLIGCFNDDSELISKVSLEQACGILKYICEQVDVRPNKEKSVKFTIGYTLSGNKYIPYCYEEKYYIALSPFICSAQIFMEQVIEICGTKFLDKIFKP